MTQTVASCHCGRIRLGLDLPDGLQNLRRCNCSLCKRKGAVMASVSLAGLHVLEGEDDLRVYTWNTHAAKHYFCGVCGIYTGVDPYALGDIAIGDGASQSVEA